MATTVDNFNVRFGADFKDLIAEMRKGEIAAASFRTKISTQMGSAQRALQKVADDLKASMRGIATSLAATLAPAALIRSVQEIEKQVTETLKWANSLDVLGKQLNVSTDFLQAFGRVAEQNGVSVEAWQKGLEKAQENLSKFSLGEKNDVLTQLGLSPKAAGDIAGNLEKGLPKIADMIAGLNRASKVTVADAIFGKSAEEFLPILEKGSAALAYQVQKMKEQGTVSQTLIALASEYHAKLQEISAGPATKMKELALELSIAWVDITKEARNFGDTLKNVVLPILESGPFGEFLRMWQTIINQRQAIRTGTVFDQRASDLQKEISRFEAIPDSRLRDVDRRRLGEARAELASIQQQQADAARLNAAATGRTSTPGKPGQGRALTLGELDPFEKKIMDLERESQSLLDVLDFGPAAASFNRLMAEFQAGDGKIAPTKKQVEDFGEALRLKQWREGLVALSTMREETIASAEAARLEALGQKEAAEAVRIKFELTRTYGPAFAAAQEGWIEQMARYKVRTAEANQQLAEIASSIENQIGSAVTGLTDAFDKFFESNKAGWAALRDVGLNAMKAIANEILRLGVIKPIGQAASSGIGGLLSLIGIGNAGQSIENGGGFAGLIESIIGGTPSGGGMLTFAEGGRPPLNMPSIVGEKGPEVFWPDTAGTIIPNRAFASGGTVNLFGSDSATIEIGVLKGALKQMGIRVNQLDRSVEPRAIAATYDAKRSGGTYANTFG